MALSEVFTWQRTSSALDALEALLRCSGCGVIATEPRRYGRCAHVFCGPCADISGTCTSCAVPSEAREQRTDTTLSAMAAGCAELRQLLGLGGAQTAPTHGSTAPPRDSTAPVERRERSPRKKAERDVGDGRQKEEVKEKEGGNKARQKKESQKKDDGDVAGNTEKERKSEGKGSKTKRNVEKPSDKPAENPGSSKKPCAPPSGQSGTGGRRTQSSGSSLVSSAGLTKRNAKGETRLHAACVRGDLERVSDLLAAGASPNTQDNAGWTPLHEACEAGRLELAAALLEAGALPDPPGLQLRTPLHEAVAAGRAELAALLVGRGADPDARCLYGTTPRQLAAGRAEMEAALDTPRQTPSTSQTEHSADGAVVLAATELSTSAVGALKKTATRLGWKFAAAVTDATTHLVCAERPPGLSVPRLRALLAGAWLVTADWTDACAEAGHTLPAEPWHVAGEAGSRACRRRQRLQPPLLTGLHVYLQGAFKQLPRAELTSLIQLAGGLVLSRPPNPEAIPPAEKTVAYHAAEGSPLRNTSHLVIFEEPPAIQYDMAHVKSLPLAWLLLSLETHTLADPIR
ncbi:BRCA1-associated RING domain protein 1 [Amphibalanus amphitrite]|uniref:BRCA1-associated RING domain protein 1 n=1 Tax=Amphibalanus amphitrite TaxID=1232801 RepID=A0A6A4WUD6_AMPAM|nr:BRCA1-associated RING domain protein 1 [Amphibalanus amphitrite]